MLEDKSFIEISTIFAKLSAATYHDNAENNYNNLGFKKYQRIINSDAAADVAVSDSEIIIACRGTVPTKIHNWIADFEAIPKTHGVGWVHSGFRSEARKIMGPIFAFVKTHRGKKIYLTGHSLGAAMAFYIAQELEYAGFEPQLLVTFGEPRLGNSTFVKSVKIKHYRFINCNDIVPHVPPLFFLYEHHGTRCYINYRGKITSRWTWVDRMIDSALGHLKAWSKFEIFDAIHDHSIQLYVSKLTSIQDTDQQNV